jgi:FkbM family methyltransferase
VKELIQLILQRTFGWSNYLKIFALFNYVKIKFDQKENDFFYFLQLIPPQTNVLDIGANIGVTTAYLSKKNQVFAFEPIPINIQTLQWLLRILHCKNIHLFNFALGNKNEIKEMIMPTIKGVKKHGLATFKQKIYEKGECYPIKVCKLDDMDFANNLKISAIKLDVENYEFEVLEGAKNSLKKNKPIIYCELWENDNRINVFNLMEELNYQILILKNKTLTGFNPNIDKKQTFFFLPN